MGEGSQVRLGPGVRSFIPAVSCPCGEPHKPYRRYYVSVIEHPDSPKSSYVLALGPFSTHPEALARVDVVRTAVQDRYNPHGRAHWYGYGTASLPADDNTTGRLNAELGFSHLI